MQLNAVYFCLLFSMAMPVFYLLSFFSILSLFLTSKIIFGLFTRQPQVYDHKLNSFISSAIAVALVLHQFASLYAITVNDIFPSNEPVLLSLTACRVIYYVFAFLLALIAFNMKRVAEIVEKKLFGKPDELMMTEEINSTFGADRKEKR